MAESLKVAVRVRPFNDREKKLGSVNIIKMNGNCTEILNPGDEKAPPKKFTFDYSYWSHDEYKELPSGYLEPASPRYADQVCCAVIRMEFIKSSRKFTNIAEQQRVFDDLGRGVLDNAWKGYNCSLFAYGQTGSGKSYSIVGYGANKGIVPIFSDDLFKGIEEKRKTAGQNEDYMVKVSMLEIYNEHVRDLLNTKTNVKNVGGLKVREDPKKGIYVESLITSDVNSYNDIENRIKQGTKNRTVAATNMNETSSRAHTIVAITFVQKTPNKSGQSMTKTSIVNLVDLAGSERVVSSGATGDRLKEASKINLSLSTLGNVINALAEQSKGTKKVHVPYRDSVLTRLLQNALGGNSKTVMIAALSPAAVNYEETLSTLRFADRAKSIKTKATINESPTDKLIRELKEENARLLAQLKAGGIKLGEGGPTSEEFEALKEKLKKTEEEMADMEKTWQQRMQENAKDNQVLTEQDRKREADRKVIPHFWNLHEDPALTAMLIYFCNTGVSNVGNKNASPEPEILLNGLSIQKEHAVVRNNNNKVTLTPQPEAKILVNGSHIVKETELHHNDRVLFGPNHLFVFHHPQDLAKQMKGLTVSQETPTFESAQEEIAKASGLLDAEGMSKEHEILKGMLVEILPMVNKANEMSKELKKKKSFEIVLVSPLSMGKKDGLTQVKVKMMDKNSNFDWLWDRETFINRKDIMEEMYQKFLNDEDWDLPQNEDPFWEPDSKEKLIGLAMFILKPLAYKIDADDTVNVTDFRGDIKAHIKIGIFPCTESGQPLTNDFVDNPDELVGKPLYFKIKIEKVNGLPFNIETTFCRYKFYLENTEETTENSRTTNTAINYEKMFTCKPVTSQLVDYLKSETLNIEVWGRHKSKESASNGKTSEKKVTTTPGPKPAAEKKDDKKAQEKSAKNKK